MKSFATTVIGVIIAVLVGGCAPGEESVDDDSDWSIERGALRLEEDLYLSETEEYFIGSANDLEVGPDGRMYVADGEEHHVKVLSPDGELEGIIGDHGEGPGEFERPRQVDIARGDSVYVFDNYRGRMSVFSPDHDFAYSFRMRGDRRSARTPMILENGGFLVVQSPFARQVAQNDETYQVRTVSANGVLGDTLFGAPPYQQVMEELDRAMRFYSVPFSRASHFHLGSDGHVHFAYGDSLGVSVYDRRGKLQETMSIPFDPVPVKDADLERAFEGWPSEGRSLVEPEVPETKPAFTDFAMDESGRYWFKRPTADPEEVEWWVADPDRRRVLTGRAPSPIDFSVIQDGYAYGTIRGNDQLPAVVRYRIEEPS